MPPGQLHAVYTPENCLAIGGHFYTLPSYPQTIDAIRAQLLGQAPENETISAELFENLIFINQHLRMLEDDQHFSEIRQRLRLQMTLLLADLGYEKSSTKKAGSCQPRWIEAFRKEHENAREGKDKMYFTEVKQLLDTCHKCIEWL